MTKFLSKKTSVLPLASAKVNNIGTDIKLINNSHPSSSTAKRKIERT